MNRILLVVALLAALIVVPRAEAEGSYTSTQTSDGASVYVQSCGACHGLKLQGEAGPPLIGPTLKAAYGAGTAAQLYDFISRQMPQNAPGTLSQQQYLDVTAYILAQNGLPAGNAPLAVASLGEVRLSEMRMSQATVAANTNEIVRAAPPIRRVYGQPPAVASVDVTDSMMLNASADGSNWVLPGRTYDNERYSSASQITAENVKSLQLVALSQTGMPASFETTPIVVNGVMYITTPVVNRTMKIMALNAASGERLWEVTYNLGPFQVCCGPVNRGVAAGYGNVYVVTLDDKLLALDARDGHTVWQSTIVSSQYGYSETLQPQIYDGLVIIGSAGGEWALQGFIAAYDARTGQQRWRWMTTDPNTYGGFLEGRRRDGVEHARDRPSAGTRHFLHRQSKPRSRRDRPSRRQPV